MNDLIAKLALEWLRAEKLAVEGTDDADTLAKNHDAIAIATDRVYRILAGEMKWSETGAGDKAIWRGRFRDVERFEAAWKVKDDQAAHDEAPQPVRPTPSRPGYVPNYPSPLPTFNPPSSTVRARRDIERAQHRLAADRTERRWWNWYDTLQFGAHHGRAFIQASQRMFNNTNYGNWTLCNLEIPGQLAPDNEARMHGCYVSSTSLEGLLLFSQARFHISVGEHPATPPMFVRDLVMGVVFRVPIKIPRRQNMHVTFETQPSVIDRAYELEPFDLTFHIDGIKIMSAQ